MLEKCTSRDFSDIYTVINDAAVAYKDVIPPDRWHEPYMTETDLKGQISDGVEFWCYKEGNNIMGVMGIQDKGEVMLIRHAYVRTMARNKGIGGKLLSYLKDLTNKPILIGTWAAAEWAIKFYEKHGFRLLPEAEKDRLLGIYWEIPGRQKETSVVLASADWKGSK